MKVNSKNLIVTLTDGTQKKIGIDLLGALHGKIGAPPNDPMYLNFAMEACAGFVDAETKDTDHPVIIGAGYIKKIMIDLGSNLTYEQEFLSGK